MSEALLSCSAAGYTTMVQQIISLVLLIYTLFKSLITAFLSIAGAKYVARAIDLLYSFLTGTGDWIGFAIAAAYYFGLEFGYGEYLCTASQYGYVVIYYLNIAVTL